MWRAVVLLPEVNKAACAIAVGTEHHVVKIYRQSLLKAEDIVLSLHVG